MSFRIAITQFGLQYAVGIESSTNRLGAGAITIASPFTQTRPWSAAQTLTTQCGPSAHFGKAAGSRLAAYGLEERRLAPRQSRNVAFSFRRCPRTSRGSRL